MVSLITFFLVLAPHLVWLSENNYITITYALSRTGMDEINYLNHLFYPFIFLGKQVGILIPFFIMFVFTISKFKTKFNVKDKKLLFLLTINIIPVVIKYLHSIVKRPRHKNIAVLFD